MGQPVYLRNVVTLKLDGDKCVGCGVCLSVCPHAVLRLVNRKLRIGGSLENGRKVEIADRDACMECGACSRNCPVRAVTVSTGVGCAAAVINSFLGRKNTSCCCTIDSPKTPCDDVERLSGIDRPSCC